MLLGGRRSLIDLLRYSPSFLSRAYSSLHYHPALNGSNIPFANRSFHVQGPRKAPKRQKFFSSNVPPQNSQKDHDGQETPKSQKKKTRSPPGKTSLRRVAVEAQRSRDIKEQRKQTTLDGSEVPKHIALLSSMISPMWLEYSKGLATGLILTKRACSRKSCMLKYLIPCLASWRVSHRARQTFSSFPPARLLHGQFLKT
ncbi:MAG: hypothetical protein Q9214_002574 [Letrouitia sp. 1 TL-2023]